jgi:hypothetical protein
MKEIIGLYVCVIGISFTSINLISGALASTSIERGNAEEISNYNVGQRISQSSRYEVIDLVPITVSTYARGCGSTERCETTTDVAYLGIPLGCRVLGNPERIDGEIFGRVSLPKTTFLPRGSRISDSTFQDMSQSNGISASVSSSTYGKHSGRYNTSFASRDNRSASFVTNIDIVRISASATGRNAFIKGKGSKAEYTLKFKARCAVR